ncbi:MAG: glycosyltransferase family 2 protein [Candidatus Contendobacter sp.]|jgi:GT2 family glycosyltransferase|nr:glycosyltransferase family 2 protein [Candidatus Contendobacter sp.]
MTSKNSIFTPSPDEILSSASDLLPMTAVVILNWNRAADTIECLESLLPAVAAGLGALLCCDNASSDDSVTVLESWGRQYFPEPAPSVVPVTPHRRPGGGEFLLLRTERNGGYAAGNNAALRYLLSLSRYRFIWLLNNDTVVEAHALPKLLAYACRHPRAGAIGSTLVDYHHRELVQCAGGCRYLPVLTVMWNVLGGRPLREVMQSSKVVRLDYVHGAAMMLSTSVIAEVGLLNEQFFLYYEEADYARRLHSKGYELAWCRDSMVYHKGAVSTGGRATAKQPESTLANYHENLSTLLFTWLHYPYLLLPAAGFRLIMKTIVFLLYRRGYLFKPLLGAYRDFMRLAYRKPKPLAVVVLFDGTC